MTAPTLVTAVGTPGSVGATQNVTKPNGCQIGDRLVVSFLMNGTPTVPTGWTVKLSGDNTNVIVYATVDGSNIPAANDSQVFAFGNGGGAQYYSYVIGIVRGAHTGDLFDAVIGSGASSGTQTPNLSVTTTGLDRLLVLFAHNFASGDPGVTNVTTPLTMVSAAGNAAHTARGEQAAAGASGNKRMTYNGATLFNASQLVAIAPSSEDDLIEIDATEGGRRRWGGRK